MPAALLLLLAAAAPMKVAAPGLRGVGLERSLSDAYLDRLVALLQETGAFEVTTARDLEQLVGLDRQRQLLGCEDQGSCIAELSNALGVEAVLSGSVAKTTAGLLVTLRLVRARDGAALDTESAQLADEAALFDWLRGAATRMSSAVQPASSSSRGHTLVPGIAGLAAVAGGSICLGIARGDAETLKGDVSRLSDADISAAASRGKALQLAGLLLVGAGAIAVALSTVWFFSTPAPVSASVAIVPGGAGVSVGGTF